MCCPPCRVGGDLLDSETSTGRRQPSRPTRKSPGVRRAGVSFSDGSRPARDLLDVADEPALRSDYFPVGAGGVTDRPMAGPLEVIGVRGLGHAEMHQEG